MALMLNALPNIPKPENSPFVSFAEGTKEREALKKELERLRDPQISLSEIAIPLWINGPVKTGKNRQNKSCTIPHDLNRILGFYNQAQEEDVEKAVEVVLNARERWSQVPWPIRLNIFRRAARLLETKYLIPIVAAVMEDYSKNPYEAFIDVQELIDFLNFNVYYASQIYAEQPDSDRDTTNILDYQPHEGFVWAIGPNNFIAINGNLCTAPLIMGNVVIAKPASDVVYSFSLFLNILHEAGLPADVLAVLYGDAKTISDVLLEHPMLAGVHFTGGTDTFSDIWKRVGQNINKYKCFPKLVGETGGKDAIVVYDDHDPLQTATAIVVGAFGYQGRKCSATSRVYMTPKMYYRVKPHLETLMNKIKIGDVADFRNYMGAIINEREYQKIKGYTSRIHQEKSVIAVLERGELTSPSGSGWFINPTVIVTDDPDYRTMREEIFGPVVTICTIPEARFEKEVLKICDSTSPYALTGAIHTTDIVKFCEALHELRFAAGNTSDDRTTAAMVHKQPFSGGRKSGTNSKVGWKLNLYNWINPRTICLRLSKTTFPPSFLE